MCPVSCEGSVSFKDIIAQYNYLREWLTLDHLEEALFYELKQIAQTGKHRQTITGLMDTHKQLNTYIFVSTINISND